VEKYFKAILEEDRGITPLTHDLEELLNRVIVQRPALGLLRPGLDRLTLYAVEHRYPGKRARAHDTRVALRRMEFVCKAVRKELGLRERRSRNS
jgi:HEPN domain-containing protein